MSERIPSCAPYFTGKERTYLLEAIDSGWISSMGPFIGRFEQAIATQCGVAHVESCSNGTVALHLLLHALGVGPGDEVIVPSETFVASANAAHYCGAKLVFCEIDEHSWVIDVADALSRVTDKTKAIIGVDLFGVMADYDGISAGLAAMGRPDVKVIEDAAEAIGSRTRGKYAGSFGHGAMFSFFGNKTVTTGEGGAIATNDLALGARMKFLKNHGMDTKRRYYHPEIGFNYRMTNMQAAVGVAQLESFDFLCDKKRQGHARYRELMAGTSVRFAKQPADQDVVPWLHAFVDDAIDGEEARDAILARMAEVGVDARPFFVPIHLFPGYAHLDSKGLDRTVRLAARGLAMPSSADLTDEQIKRSVDAYFTAREGHLR